MYPHWSIASIAALILREFFNETHGYAYGRSSFEPGTHGGGGLQADYSLRQFYDLQARTPLEEKHG